MAIDSPQCSICRKVITPIPPKIMGILNLTPDSFSDGGAYVDTGEAMRAGRRMISEGAQILDVGGMASGPGSILIDETEELNRIISVVKALSHEGILSIDTFRSTVARPCLEAGAQVINDISALRHDHDLAKVIKEFSASVVLMYSKESAEHPLVTKIQRPDGDLIADITAFFSERIEIGLRAGLAAQQIILDPGMGAFVSSDPNHSWEILDRIGELRARFSEFQLLISVSRKGFLGGSVHARDTISQLVAKFAVDDGVDIVRTHNVALADKILRCCCSLSERGAL